MASSPTSAKIAYAALWDLGAWRAPTAIVMWNIFMNSKWIKKMNFFKNYYLNVLLIGLSTKNDRCQDVTSPPLKSKAVPHWEKKMFIPKKSYLIQINHLMATGPMGYTFGLKKWMPWKQENISFRTRKYFLSRRNYLIKSSEALFQWRKFTLQWNKCFLNSRIFLL